MLIIIKIYDLDIKIMNITCHLIIKQKQKQTVKLHLNQQLGQIQQEQQQVQDQPHLQEEDLYQEDLQEKTIDYHRKS